MVTLTLSVVDGRVVDGTDGHNGAVQFLFVVGVPMAILALSAVRILLSMVTLTLSTLLVVVPIVQSACRRLLASVVAAALALLCSPAVRSSMWRLTPVVRIAGSTGLCFGSLGSIHSVLLLLLESHGLPRSHFCDARSHLFNLLRSELHSGNAFFFFRRQ
jgi:hypothetical protein